MTYQHPVTHPTNNTEPTDPRFTPTTNYAADKPLDPTILCAYCEVANAHTETDPGSNFTRRLAIGYWAGDQPALPICREHALTFEQEEHPNALPLDPLS